jgi:hypothetical protein
MITLEQGSQFDEKKLHTLIERFNKRMNRSWRTNRDDRCYYHNNIPTTKTPNLCNWVFCDSCWLNILNDGMHNQKSIVEILNS